MAKRLRIDDNPGSYAATYKEIYDNIESITRNIDSTDTNDIAVKVKTQLDAFKEMHKATEDMVSKLSKLVDKLELKDTKSTEEEATPPLSIKEVEFAPTDMKTTFSTTKLEKISKRLLQTYLKNLVKEYTKELSEFDKTSYMYEVKDIKETIIIKIHFIYEKIKKNMNER
jgi:hypothetical protein